MNLPRRLFRFGIATWIVGVVAGAAACSSNAPPDSGESLGVVSSAAFVNGDFEASTVGQAPAAPWVLTPYLGVNNTGVTIQSPQTRAGLNLQTGGNLLTSVVSGTGADDPDMGPNTLKYCRFGSKCARINFHSSTDFGNGRNINSLAQTMTIAAGDVDAADGKPHVRFAIAPVLEDIGHPAKRQPYFFVQVTNITKANAVLHSDFNFANQSGVPWKSVVVGTGPAAQTFRYTDWQMVDVAPGAGKMDVGDQIKLEVIGAGCSQGGHEGYVYLDGVGTTIPGLFVSGSAPTQVNPGSPIVYALSYKNGGTGAESGVVIDFTTPPGTTFASFTAPAGATCTTPAVGAAGTIVCTFTSPVAAGATGTFSVTVNTTAATGSPVVEGNYDIKSTTAPALLGNKITTYVGCANDAQCATGNWCNITAKTCGPTLPNGTTMPTDAGHTTPTLNGKCNAGAGTLVCKSGKCDADDKCGLANGTGTCTAANGATLCRSGVCDTADGKCGYAVGDGPCTAANGATVCRSGACSVNGLCEPTGGCNVDADCTGGKWCMEATHTCTPKLANGTAMPTDAPHTSPTLDGKCAAAAATLVCAASVCDSADDKCGYANGDGSCDAMSGPTVCRSAVCGADTKCGLANGEGTCDATTGGTICRSAVCDTDGKCGYADGDGPCTAANGAQVCRSGACAPTTGKCLPAGGCAADSDCTGGKWCDVSSFTCMPKIANGTVVPTDPKHGTPVLDGKCSTEAGALTCVAGVCDAADDKCGYADGDGPCDATNGATVCRSGACSASGKCMAVGACLADADCPSGWCNVAAKTCAPKVDNGGSMPSDTGHTTPALDGKCSTDAGALVCKSAACDTADDKCGLANGHACAVGEDVKCRAGVCFAADSKCGKPNGETCGSNDECRDGSCIDGKCDKDSDGDGISDSTEATLGTDPNDPDSDHDGVKDNVEASADHSGNGPFSKVDTDSDGTIDALDTDDDNDSIPTKDELGTGGGASPRDTDNDGKKDYLDADDDDDTIPTKQEVEQSKLAGVDSDDVDDDGKKNWLDTDSDSDSILDKDEPNDGNGDGIPDYLQKVGTRGPDAGSLEGGGCSTSNGGSSNAALALFGAALALGARSRRRRGTQG